MVLNENRVDTYELCNLQNPFQTAQILYWTRANFYHLAGGRHILRGLSTQTEVEIKLAKDVLNDRKTSSALR